jgi:hypothetical protein
VQYEELRSQALACVGRGLGLTLFLRQGMCAWIRACAQSILVVQKMSAGRVAAVDPGEVLVPPELTMLLAGLALHVCEEVFTHDDRTRQ